MYNKNFWNVHYNRMENTICDFWNASTTPLWFTLHPQSYSSSLVIHTNNNFMVGILMASKSDGFHLLIVWPFVWSSISRLPSSGERVAILHIMPKCTSKRIIRFLQNYWLKRQFLNKFGMRPNWVTYLVHISARTTFHFFRIESQLTWAHWIFS